MKRVVGLIIIATAASLLQARIVNAGDACISDWTEAQSIVEKHDLAKVEELSLSARQAGLGHVLKARLCQGASGYEYHVILRDAHGALSRRVTAARKPFTELAAGRLSSKSR